VVVAAALASACKALNVNVLASREAICPSMRAVFRAMGRIALRASPAIEVFEGAPDFPPEAGELLNAAYARFDAGETAALDDIAALSGQFPDDEALKGLLSRLAAAGPGGAYSRRSS
jgi:adenylate cyclase